MAITVITNNVPRDIIEAHELTEDERSEFDYIDWKDVEMGRDNPMFFRYKGEVYDLGEMEGPIELEGERWDQHISETFFSGIVIRWMNLFEQVVVGRYYG